MELCNECQEKAKQEKLEDLQKKLKRKSNRIKEVEEVEMIQTQQWWTGEEQEELMADHRFEVDELKREIAKIEAEMEQLT